MEDKDLHTIVVPADEALQWFANNEKTKRAILSSSSIYRDFAAIGIDRRKKVIWRRYLGVYTDISKFG